MGLIQGIPVVLYLQTKTDQVDGFGNPIYTETPTTIDNVLVNPISAEAITSDLQLYGRRGEYELCIPKGTRTTGPTAELDFSATPGEFTPLLSSGSSPWYR